MFRLFPLFPASYNAKTAPASIEETEAVRLLYLCFFKRSRNYLRGFLIAAWAGAKITGFLLSRNIISFSVEPVALFSQAPRMRGKELNTVLFIVSDGITPAYAGKRCLQCQHSPQHWDHPRICGEKLLFIRFALPRLGSPPRMRGKATVRFNCRSIERITPAYAGKSKRKCENPTQEKDHPRVCGEKLFAGRFHLPILGSPPRMRGKEVRRYKTAIASGITPAYAGKSS